MGRTKKILGKPGRQGLLAAVVCVALVGPHALAQTGSQGQPGGTVGGPGIAQAPQAGTSPTVTTSLSTQQPTSPLSPRGLQGSTRAEASELPAGGQLSLEKAVELGLRHNLAILLAEERKGEARGRAAQARAALLPNLSGQVLQENVTVNLAAQGFTGQIFPGVPGLLGPFDRFDARARLVQTVFNLSALRAYQAGRTETHAAELEVELARQQVIETVAVGYLQAISANRSVETARTNLELAIDLLKLAKDQHDVGIATGLDVTRAETRVAEEQVVVARARSDAERSLIALERAVGIPLDMTVTLTDPLRFTPEVIPPVTTLVTEAQRDRAEVGIAQQEAAASRALRQSVEAERLPSVDVAGDYGLSGNTPVTNDLPTRTFGVRVNVPLFTGGLTQGRIEVARSREREAELQLGDVLGEVEEDVRLAVLDEGTAVDEVSAAEQAVTLGERQVKMARDRFAAGVANNIEVIEAQTSLANARQALVSALARYNAARINLAAARGQAERFRW